MSNAVIPFAEIETHLECAEKWNYEHQLAVATSDDAKSYERRGQLLKDVLFAVSEAEPGSDAEAIEIATTELEQRWESYTTDSLYIADRQQRFDKAATREALREYLRGPGLDHIRNAVAWDETVALTRLTDHLITISLDIITETDEGLLVLQFVPNLRDVSFGSGDNDDAQDHIDRSSYGGRYLGSVLRAELAIRATNVIYSSKYDDLQVAYTVVGMVESVSTTGTEGTAGTVVVEPEYRDLTGWHEEYGESNAELLASIANQIADERTEIPEAFIEDIRSNTCRYCTYRNMCQSHLNWEVEF